MAYLDNAGVITLTHEIKSYADETYTSNSSIGTVYDSTKAYAIGEYCLKDGILYCCITAIGTGGEAWNPTHWNATTTSDEIEDLKTAKQDTLVSGTNIKTLNGSSVLGSGDLSVGGQVHVGTAAPTDPNIQIWLDTDEPGMSGVSSVNGATGTVVLDAEDVGAMFEWELLWQNASPESEFTAQTIPLTLTDFDFVFVITKAGLPSDAVVFGTICKNGETTPAQYILNSAGTSNGYPNVSTRNITVSSTGVTFEGGYTKYTNVNTAPTASNNRCLPVFIYGIRGVQTS